MTEEGELEAACEGAALSEGGGLQYVFEGRRVWAITKPKLDRNDDRPRTGTYGISLSVRPSGDPDSMVAIASVVVDGHFLMSFTTSAPSAVAPMVRHCIVHAEARTTCNTACQSGRSLDRAVGVAS